jgi:hypothetical protein
VNADKSSVSTVTETATSPRCVEGGVTTRRREALIHVALHSAVPRRTRATPVGKKNPAGHHGESPACHGAENTSASP